MAMPASCRKRGGKSMSRWLTPEQVEKMKERRKIYVYVSIPVIAALFGAIVTFLANML
jgi:hypothetical protein